MAASHFAVDSGPRNMMYTFFPGFYDWHSCYAALTQATVNSFYM